MILTEQQFQNIETFIDESIFKIQKQWYKHEITIMMPYYVSMMFFRHYEIRHKMFSQMNTTDIIELRWMGCNFINYSPTESIYVFVAKRDFGTSDKLSFSLDI